MSMVRYIAYENKLAKMISKPGGKTVDEAVSDAEANLASISDACLADIDRLIGVLTAAVASGKPEDDQILYVASREIAGLAAICSLPRLGEAAHSLCVLIDNSEAVGRPHREAVTVHVSTLQLMRGLAQGNDPMQIQLARSLQDMVRRLADEDRGAPAVGKAHP